MNKKKAISWLLTLCMVLGLLPAMVFGAAAAAAPSGYTSDANGIMAYRYQGSGDFYGRFDVQGYYNNTWEPVTYANRGFSTVVKIDDTNYTVNATRDTYTIVGTADNSIGVRTYFDLVNGGKVLKINYAVYNGGNSDVTFSLASGGDVEMNGAVNAINTDDGVYMTGAGGEQLNLWGRDTYGVTDVSNIWYGAYGALSTSYFGSATGGLTSGTDAALAWSWNDKNLAAGQMEVYSVLMSVGGADSQNSAVSCTVDFSTVLGVKPESVTVSKGDSLPTLPALEQERYTFGGWYTSSVYQDSTKVTAPLTVNTNTTLYAKWLPLSYATSVTVQKDGAAWTGLTLSLRQGGKTYSLTDTENDGVYTDSVPTGSYDVYKDGVNTGVDVTVASGATSTELNYWTATVDTKLDGDAADIGEVTLRVNGAAVHTLPNSGTGTYVLVVSEQNETNYTTYDVYVAGADTNQNLTMTGSGERSQTVNYYTCTVNLTATTAINDAKVTLRDNGGNVKATLTPGTPTGNTVPYTTILQRSEDTLYVYVGENKTDVVYTPDNATLVEVHAYAATVTVKENGAARSGKTVTLNNGKNSYTDVTNASGVMSATVLKQSDSGNELPYTVAVTGVRGTMEMREASGSPEYDYYTVTCKNGDAVYFNQNVLKNTAATRPNDPTSGSDTFIGWMNGGSTYNFASDVTAALTLTASFVTPGVKIGQQVYCDSTHYSMPNLVITGFGDKKVVAVDLKASKGTVSVKSDTSTSGSGYTYNGQYFEFASGRLSFGKSGDEYNAVSTSVAEEILRNCIVVEPDKGTTHTLEVTAYAEKSGGGGGGTATPLPEEDDYYKNYSKSKNPVRISTEQELITFLGGTDDFSYYAILINDINLDISKLTTRGDSRKPVKNLNGNGYKITVTAPTDYNGQPNLINTLYSTIENLEIAVNIQSCNSSYASYSPFCTQIDSDGKVKNVKISGILLFHSSFTQTSSYIVNVGGIASKITGGTIENCDSRLNITINRTESVNPITVKAGSVVGTKSGGTITNCYSDKEPTVTGDYASNRGKIEGSNSVTPATSPVAALTKEYFVIYHGPSDATSALDAVLTHSAFGVGSSDARRNKINSGAVTLTTQQPYIPAGATFSGWSKNADGSGTLYQPGQSITGLSTGNLDLYAVIPNPPGDVTAKDTLTISVPSDIPEQTTSTYTVRISRDNTAADLGVVTIGGQTVYGTVDGDSYVYTVVIPNGTGEKPISIGGVDTGRTVSPGVESTLAYVTKTVTITGVNDPPELTLTANSGTTGSPTVILASDNATHTHTYTLVELLPASGTPAYSVSLDGTDTGEDVVFGGDSGNLTFNYKTVNAVITGSTGEITSVELRDESGNVVPLTIVDGKYSATRPEDKGSPAAQYTLYINGVEMTGKTADFKNGGSISGVSFYVAKVTTYIDNSIADLGTVLLGETAMVRTGDGTYELVTGSNAQQTLTVNGYATGFCTPGTAATVNFYTISFAAGTTGTPPASLVLPYGSSFTLPEPTGLTAPGGKVFAGWKYGSGSNLAAGSTATVNEKTTYTAQWTDSSTLTEAQEASWIVYDGSDTTAPQYGTLAQALDAANATGLPVGIAIRKNITITGNLTIPANAAVTIAEQDGDTEITVNVNGTLTVNGSLTVSGDNADGSADTDTNGATLNIISGGKVVIGETGKLTNNGALDVIGGSEIPAASGGIENSGAIVNTGVITGGAGYVINNTGAVIENAGGVIGEGSGTGNDITVINSGTLDGGKIEKTATIKGGSITGDVISSGNVTGVTVDGGFADTTKKVTAPDGAAPGGTIEGTTTEDAIKSFFGGKATVATAPDGKKTITLTGDVTLAAPIVINADYTLDLSGHKLTGGVDGDGNGVNAVKVTGGNVTVTDSVGGGGITGGNGGSVENATGKNGGAGLTVSGGTVIVGGDKPLAITGGIGGTVIGDNTLTGGTGGVGLAVTGGTVTVNEPATVTGGKGGSALPLKTETAGTGGNGGNGLVISSPGEAVFNGATPTGGNGGNGGTGGNGGSGAASDTAKKLTTVKAPVGGGRGIGATPGSDGAGYGSENSYYLQINDEGLTGLTLSPKTVEVDKDGKTTGTVVLNLTVSNSSMYSLPQTVTLTVNGTTLTATYDAAAGKLTIPKSTSLTPGGITISAAAVKKGLNDPVTVTTFAQLKEAIDGGFTNITLSNNVTVSKDLALPTGVEVNTTDTHTLTIDAGKTLTNNGTLTGGVTVNGTLINNKTITAGSLMVGSGGVLTNNKTITADSLTVGGAGKLTNNSTGSITTTGDVTVNGTLTNDGTLAALDIAVNTDGKLYQVVDAKGNFNLGITVTNSSHKYVPSSREKAYKISFSPAGNGDAVIMTTAQLPTLPDLSANPNFEGWYLDSGYKKPAVAGDPITGSVTLYAKIKNTGGGGGSQTVTVPAKSDEGSTNVTVSVSGDKATISATDTQLDEIASHGKPTGTVTVDVSSLKVDTAVIPANVVSSVNEATGSDGLEVLLPTGGVKLDATALEAVGNKTITVSVEDIDKSALSDTQTSALEKEEGNVKIVDVNVFVNGVKTSNFNGGVITVAVPYTAKAGEDTSRIAVFYLADDGSITKMNGHYDAAGRRYVFTTTHLSTYVLVTPLSDGSFPFTDVFKSDYYYDAVVWALENFITAGKSDTTFAPDETCTRAQAVTFLWRTMGSPKPTTTVCPFTDVIEGTYYYEAVLWAAEKGITLGTSDTTFSPYILVNRAQAVTFLWRTAGSKVAGTINPFADVKNDAYYRNAVLWAVANEITDGKSATAFAPADTCTRGQIVTFLWRYAK